MYIADTLETHSHIECAYKGTVLLFVCARERKSLLEECVAFVALRERGGGGERERTERERKKEREKERKRVIERVRERDRERERERERGERESVGRMCCICGFVAFAPIFSC